jgi:hypothetical protein
MTTLFFDISILSEKPNGMSRISERGIARHFVCPRLRYSWLELLIFKTETLG